jgi:S-DNA-T family DNA segregation ATPase FtsK/SpoIIIE
MERVAAGRLPVAELRVVSGPAAGRRVPVEPGEHRVGSHRYSRIVLADATLARVHVLVRVGSDGSVTVAPASPEAPCRVDGERLAGPVPLQPGQVLAAGRSLLAVGPPGEGRREAEWPALHAPAGRLEPPAPPSAWAGGLAVGGAAAGTALAAGVTAAAWGTPAALVPIALAPAAGAAAVVWSQRGHVRARTRFRSRLAELDQALGAAREVQLARLAAGAPDAAELLLQLESGTRSRERRPGHPDFLRVRLGWADQPSGFGAVGPIRGAPALRTEALRVAVRHATLRGAPVSLLLPELGPLGVWGDPAAGLGLARWLAVQVLALSSRADVALTVALPAGAREGFAWLAGLPASRLPVPPLALGAEEGARVAQRLAALVAERGAGRAQGPAVVAILHCAVVPAIARALAVGRRLGVHVVWLGADGERRPACGALLELQAGGLAPTLALRGGEPRPLGGADALTPELAGRATASLRSAACVRPSGDELRHEVLSSWVRDRSGRGAPSPRAALGVDAAGHRVEVDLGRGGLALLLAGEPGGRRSELLRVAVASLAVRHSPRTVNLLLVGATFADLTGLPHALDVLTGPGDERLWVALAELAGELRRREAAPPGAEPALVVAVDEPAAPLRAALAGVAQHGARCRVHLLVATREPSAFEAAMGGPARHVVAADAAGRPWGIVPGAAAGVASVVEAVASVNRMLDQPAAARWPGRAIESAR